MSSVEAAKQAYLDRMAEIAATQDLSQDLRPNVRNLSIAFTGVASFFVCLRFLSRLKQGVRIGSDDWLSIVALVFLIANLVMNLVRTSLRSWSAT